MLKDLSFILYIKELKFINRDITFPELITTKNMISLIYSKNVNPVITKVTKILEP